MTMNQAVFLSLLSMDSYNRRYGQNIYGLSNSGSIGTATILTDSVATLGSSSQSTGFYAIAYEWNGSEVISYRGTNPEFSTDSVGSFLNSPLVKDIWNGWTLGAGFASAAQGGLAIDFYEAVSGRSVYSAIGGSTPILLTGHSLGGGLAGFVGALSSHQAYGFDHMPFGLAAWAQVLSESLTRAAAQHNLSYASLAELLHGIETGSLMEIVNGTLTLAAFAQSVFDNLQELAPYAGALTGFSIDGEALSYVRDGTAQVAIGGILGGLSSLLGFPLLGAAIAGYGGTLAYTTAELEAEVEKTTFDVYGAELDPIQKHSISLLTTLMFGEQQWSSDGGKTDWHDSAKYILTATMDDILAQNAFDLIKDETGVAPGGAQMSSMIAYSAIDEGERPFGDTGIRALFNDADDFGQALKVDAALLPASFDESARKATGKLIVEFAGLLAKNKILQSDNENATQGVLLLDEGTPTPSVMIIDLRAETWTVAGVEHDISVKDELIDSFIKSSIDTNYLNKIQYWYKNSANYGGTSDLIKDINEITITLKPKTIYGSLDEDGMALHIGSNQADNFQFSDGSDFVIGGLGSDTLWGKGGVDILLGGDGNDVLDGGSGNDWLDGGLGFDTAYYLDNTNLQPINIEFDGTSFTPTLTVKDGLGGTDSLHSIEKIIATSGNDTFSFKGTIPVGYNLWIASGGGAHDKIDLQQATDSAGMKLYITNQSTGDGYIQSRSGAGGIIHVTNFHTDITGSEYADIISDNSSGDHTIDAGAGDDTITVSGSGATIDGGAGNDVIHLKSAAATIQFGVGGGHDVVEFDSGDGDYNLALQNLNPNDVEIIAGGRYIYGSGIWETGNPNSDGWHAQFIAVRIRSTGDTITFLENGDNIGPGASTYDAATDPKKLDSITFSDGTTITQSELWSVIGDSPSSFVNGTEVRFDAWAYNKDYPNYGPYLRQAAGYLDYVNATYLQAAPISAPPPPPDQNLLGTPGDDNINPGDGNDTVTGGSGGDTIQESRGNDTYVWNSGDGGDTITGSDASDGFNTLQLGAGITPADLQFSVVNDGAGLTLSFANQSGSISLTDELVGDGYGVDRLLFADGTIMTRADLVAAASSVIAAAQTTIDGTAAADYLFAPRGNFIVDGAGGNDTIVVNGSGAGTFRFSSADGHDQINDWGLGYSRNDTLELTDVNPGGVTLARSGDALLVTVNATGATVNVTKQFEEDDGNTHGISTIAFADGTVWTRSHIHDLVYAGNTAPLAEAAAANTVQDAAIVRGMLVATDADANDTLTFKLNDPIAGLVVATNGSWSFDPSNPAYQYLAQGQQLTLTANYHVTDSAGAASSSSLALTLTGTNDMPTVLQDFGNQKLANDEAFLLDVMGHFMDPDGDTLTFSATLADGSSLPDWLTFANGQFSGTTPADASGNLDIVVAASDGTLAAYSAFHLHFGPNVAPIAQALPDVTGGINSPLDITIPTGTFTDPDGDSLALSATLADGTALPDWMSFDNGHLTGTPPTAAFGDIYNVKITATDGEKETSSNFALSIGRQEIIGTPGDDMWTLGTLFDVTGGLGNDWYVVSGDGEGTFNYSRGDGWDALDQFDSGARSDKLIFTDINSDDVSAVRYGDAVDLVVDDADDFWVSNQFAGDNPGGSPQGLDQVQFADGVSWDRNEIRNRADANEVLVDSSNPYRIGSQDVEAFAIQSGLGAGVIDNFAATGSNHDYLQFDRSQFDDWAHLLGATVQQGSDLVINLDANDSVRLTGVSMSAFTSLDVRFVGSALV